MDKTQVVSPPRTPTAPVTCPPPLLYSPSSSASPPAFSSPTSQSSPPSNLRPPASPPAIILSPCAACKILRRRCVDKCVLAPYFPPSEPLKFTTAHRVFGASNIIKFLQELPEDQRADAVSSMVYEANARIRDPVYGSAGAICHLQKQVSELQTQLAKAQADLLNMQLQQSNLIAMLCMEMDHSAQTQAPFFNPHPNSVDTTCFLDDSYSWEPLWT